MQREIASLHSLFQALTEAEMAKREPRSSSDGALRSTPQPAEFVSWTPPRGLSVRGWAILGLVVLLINAPVVHHVLSGPPPVTADLPYAQDFASAAALERDFWTSGGYWRVVDGRVISPGVKGNPLWLQASLPADLVVEFEASPLAADAEVRAVLFGDGRNAGSGYAFVQGASNATYLARLGGVTRTWSQLLRQAQAMPAAGGASQPDPVRAGLYTSGSRVRIDGRHIRVEPGAAHRWRIERRGSTVRWWIDDHQVLTFDDPFPLRGGRHDRFGINTLDGAVAFDNLKITAAGDGPATPLPEDNASRTLSPAPFADSFEDGTIGRDWNVTAPATVTESGGALVAHEAHNQPIWLRTPLARDARIEFDAWTDDPRGDIKFEAWGDGETRYSGDLRLQYRATGYVFIFGGWGNTVTAIARQDEHAPDRQTREDLRVERGRHYRMTVERRGGTILWSIDGAEALRFVDPQPLYGEFNRYFGFSGWESKVQFDNLSITPL